ncbi:hypothetical protein OESDEN_05314 [Oesophagostomum dentatum]|uniref:Uncharacterized protein n=1 Tax=Oesophagostomum dentatum TaxID=61180 RepID=A0A0B1TB25_OESDE|nr:hypothetical protein OESDEN_05314 [Oesophagostomum dentatum]
MVGSELLGSPCPKDVPSYLSILFMCVNEEVFSEDAIKGDFESLQKYLKEMEDTTSVPVVDDGWEKLSEKHIEAEPKLSAPILSPTRPEPMFSNDAGYVTEDRYSLSHGGSKDVNQQRDEEEMEQIAEVDANVIGIAHDIMLAVTFIKR